MICVVAPSLAGDMPSYTYEVMPVSLPDASIIRAQVADTPEKSALGLMFRKSLPADQGMIFVFKEAGFHSFWMKNCEIPLDMIWINDRKQVVHLERSAPPCKEDPCPSYVPAQKGRYVLELQAGTIERKKIALGQTLLFDLPGPNKQR